MMRRTLSALPKRLLGASAGTRVLTNRPASHNKHEGNPRALQFFSTSGVGGGVLFAGSSVSEPTAGSAGEPRNFFALKTKDRLHKEVHLADYANKVVLVVNVASKCGFTEQYEGLEKLYGDYKDKGFVVIGFPCNQFGKQEPGTNEEIASFCKLKYGVTFPVMDKIDVNGGHEDPVYSFLKSQKSGLLGLERIKWNFEKFLVNKDGSVYKRYSSATTPESIAADIEKLLNST